MTPLSAVDPESAVVPEVAPDILPAPETVAQLGVRRALMEDLALKTIYVTAPPSLVELATTMCVSYSVVDELFRRLRSDRLAEVTGMVGNAAQFTLTSEGRARAAELLSLNQYFGPAPVSVDSYVRQVRRQSVRDIPVHPADVRRAFRDLVLEERTLDQLGAALNSGSSIFLHGPTGTGKTAIATTIPRIFSDDYVWIPYALQADGQIITVFDPNLHKKVNGVDTEDSDLRWIACRRPTVVVGGELAIEMLELQMNPTARYYSAPMQMKANNGVLVIDDFGRQRLRPEELLNRWIVPLDRGIDFLTLAGGRKIEIPFELFVVFATNLDPSTLADAAFLRRIQTKIKVGTVSRARFHEIFRRVCAQAEIAYESSVVDALIDTIQNKYREPLRACHPRDMVNQICWAARYENREPRLDWPSLVTAVDAYFVPEPGENGD
jgi:predicted ATPase with chaperone activity